MLILRPGYFYENNFGVLGLIEHQGINGSAIEPNVSMPTIAAAADVGVAAAEALRRSDFIGVSVAVAFNAGRIRSQESNRQVRTKTTF